MHIHVAEKKDLDRIYEFYDLIIDHQKEDEYGPGWTKDIYPSYEILKDKIENDLFFIAEEEGDIIAAGALMLHEEEDYKKAKWLTSYKDDEIAVLHLYAIDPSYRGKGISQVFLEYITKEASKYVKAIHLDIVKGNLPARKTYEKAGFVLADEIEMFYIDTGTICVELMEYDIENHIS
ncbi:MAG: GNAT family N-acetyltransferase [Erysipelotrichaceae bacterium]|nr:GNAT family N-acetyltransferase [Erysipelotrichaceae bacterium]